MATPDIDAPTLVRTLISLLYPDDLILMSTGTAGLVDGLSCSVLTVNLIQTKMVVFETRCTSCVGLPSMARLLSDKTAIDILGCLSFMLPKA